MMDDQIHWFSIINSLMIVLFLSGMVAMIMMRTLHRDISKYNQLETADEAQEETGWKLVRISSFAISPKPYSSRILQPCHKCSSAPSIRTRVSFLLFGFLYHALAHERDCAPFPEKSELSKMMM